LKRPIDMPRAGKAVGMMPIVGMPYDVRRATQGIAVDSVIIQVSLPSSLHAAP